MKDNIFQNNEEVVKYVLERFPVSRNSNDLLILLVWQHVNPNVCSLHIDKVFQNRKQLGLPSVSTITRCRRKLVKEYEELAPCKEVAKKREEMKGQAIGYALDKEFM